MIDILNGVVKYVTIPYFIGFGVAAAFKESFHPIFVVIIALGILFSYLGMIDSRERK